MESINLNGLWRYRPIEINDTTLYIDPELDDHEWPEMAIPANWYRAGLDHHGIVWFRREFDMPLNEDCSVWWLEFGGVDYTCDVWLNGAYIGHHTGYFGKFRFDVTASVMMGKNSLVVRVNSPFEEIGPQGWSLHKKLIKGVLNHHDCRPGGAWSEDGQSQNTGGIWQAVYLRPYECENPPEVNDWYLPLEKPRVRVDEHTLKWRKGNQPFFPRGTNYIPAQHLASLTREDFERDLRLMKEANLNAVRIHAHVLPDVFYDLCDEMDMTVWQDFPLQWGYVDTPEFHAEALRQVEEMVRQLGHHPCIALWCVHNESPWDARWMAEKYGVPFNPHHNLGLDKKLAARVRELDPDRYVHENSGTGDGHVYPGWYGGRWQDYENAPGKPLPSEYGAQALPRIETMREMLPDWALAYNTPEARKQWEYHNFQHHETFELAGLSWGDGLESFIQTSQRYQAQILKYATETYRSRDDVFGMFQFMFVDPWPAITWSVLDYWRRPKEGYLALKNAMQPILPIACLALDWIPNLPAGQPLTFPVLVVNDTENTLTNWTLKISMTAWIPSTESQDQRTFMHHWGKTFSGVNAEPFKKVRLGEVTIPPLAERIMDYHLVLQFFKLEDELRESVVNSYALKVRID